MPIFGVEWIVLAIAVIIFLLLGPSKMPELARGIGKAVAELKMERKEGEVNEEGGRR